MRKTVKIAKSAGEFSLTRVTVVMHAKLEKVIAVNN